LDLFLILTQVNNEDGKLAQKLDVRRIGVLTVSVNFLQVSGV